uniref:Lipid scramblase CLPTM1L n=1 Tax=Astyanax mexicanus TaxID=7994 RepID=A0A3B1IVU0_ASTMX
MQHWTEINLVTLQKLTETMPQTEDQRLVTYWKSRISLNMMTEDFTFNNAAVPSDLRRYIKMGLGESVFHIYHITPCSNISLSRIKDLIEINSTTKAVPFTISYDTITLRKFRIWIHVQAVIYSLKHFGFSEQNLDEIKAMFVETGLHILALYILVPAFHLSFEVFAFKNDVSFWRGKKSLTMGKKTKKKNTLLQSNITVFFFLSQAMKFLSYLLYPLCISGAIYSFLYLKNKSWYFWIINGLVSGVYAFGFLSMVPQLYVNYKLKSAAHFPMSVLLYKGLNTFISDVFSGIISTPGPHQLACFRDDVVFLIYLYQRRIYPLNKSRCREYGASHRKRCKGKAHED